MERWCHETQNLYTPNTPPLQHSNTPFAFVFVLAWSGERARTRFRSVAWLDALACAGRRPAQRAVDEGEVFGRRSRIGHRTILWFPAQSFGTTVVAVAACHQAAARTGRGDFATRPLSIVLPGKDSRACRCARDGGAGKETRQPQRSEIRQRCPSRGGA